MLFKGDAGHLKGDAHDAPGLGIDFIAVQKWCDGHGALLSRRERKRGSQPPAPVGPLAGDRKILFTNFLDAVFDIRLISRNI
jgi:hypothetical protein